MPTAENLGISGLRTAPLETSSFFNVCACSLFVVLGVVTTLLGPILPLLMLRWSITTTQAGTLFVWQFVASTLGTALSGFVFARRSFRPAVLLGMSLCLIGIAVLAQAGWNVGRYAVAAYGFGLGVALPAINLAVAEANPLARAQWVSLLNFAWGIGAICCPVLLRVTHNLNLFLTLLSAALAAGIIGSILMSMPQKRIASTQHPTDLRGGQLWSLVPLIAFSMFLFCGIENAVSGWAASLALPHFSSVFTAVSANIAFWSFFLTSRALSPLALRLISESRLMLLSILTGVVGLVVFLVSTNALGVLLACALAGVGIGPGFPLLISRISEQIGSEHPSGTLCFAFAGLGAATLPALTGMLGSALAIPRAGLLLPLLGLVLLIPVTRSISGEHRLAAGAALR